MDNNQSSQAGMGRRMPLNIGLRLASAGDVTSIPSLVAALKHDSWVVRQRHAARGLIALGPAAVPALLEVMEGDAAPCPLSAYALFCLDASYLPLILHYLERSLTGYEAAYYDAVWVLGELGPLALELVPRLKSLAAQGGADHSVCFEAHRALVRILWPSDHVAHALMSAMRNEFWWVRRRAMSLSSREATAPNHLRQSRQGILLLGEAGDGDIERTHSPCSLKERAYSASVTVSALCRGLDDPRDDLKRDAALALGVLGPAAKEAAPMLARRLGGKLGAVCAEVLACIGPPALPYLYAALKRDDTVATQAAYALTIIGTRETYLAVEQWRSASSLSPLAPGFSDFFAQATPIQLSSRKKDDFASMWLSATAGHTGPEIRYGSEYPKHDFLSYLVKNEDVILHGSPIPGIEMLNVEGNSGLFGDEKVTGVYATNDPAVALYFAVFKHGESTGAVDGVFRGTGQRAQSTFYHFAACADSFEKCPWSEGTVYIVPREGFDDSGAGLIRRKSTRPLARLAVSPSDFPYRHQVRGYSHIDLRYFGDPFLPFLNDALRHPLRDAISP